jgi:hypothetical protein
VAWSGSCCEVAGLTDPLSPVEADVEWEAPKHLYSGHPQQVWSVAYCGRGQYRAAVRTVKGEGVGLLPPLTLGGSGDRSSTLILIANRGA